MPVFDRGLSTTIKKVNSPIKNAPKVDSMELILVSIDETPEQARPCKSV
jgi:hypothetical protein